MTEEAEPNDYEVQIESIEPADSFNTPAGDIIEADPVTQSFTGQVGQETQTANEIGQSLSRQQFSTSDSTLARMGLDHPPAGSIEESAQPVGEVAEESPYTGFQFGDITETGAGTIAETAGETAGETGAEIAGETGAEVGAEVGADVAVDTGVLGAIGTIEGSLVPTYAIPYADIATGAVGGILAVAGIAFSLYNAVEEGIDKKKTPEVQAPDPSQLAPQNSPAGHYVGASSDNYFNQAIEHYGSFESKFDFELYNEQLQSVYLSNY